MSDSPNKQLIRREVEVTFNDGTDARYIDCWNVLSWPHDYAFLDGLGLAFLLIPRDRVVSIRRNHWLPEEGGEVPGREGRVSEIPIELEPLETP